MLKLHFGLLFIIFGVLFIRGRAVANYVDLVIYTVLIIKVDIITNKLQSV